VGGEQVALTVGLEAGLVPACLGLGEHRWKERRLDAGAQVADAIPRVERPRSAETVGDERTRVLQPLVVALHRADLQHQSRAVHQGHQVLGITDRRGERLLDKHMLAGFQRLRRQGVVEPVGCRDEHRLDCVIGPDRARVGVRRRDSVADGDRSGDRGAEVAHGHELDALGLLQRRQVGDLGDATAADQRQPDGLGHASSPGGLGTCTRVHDNGETKDSKAIEAKHWLSSCHRPHHA
jgi:hypothetical protein